MSVHNIYVYILCIYIYTHVYAYVHTVYIYTHVYVYVHTYCIYICCNCEQTEKRVFTLGSG